MAFDWSNWQLCQLSRQASAVVPFTVIAVKSCNPQSTATLHSIGLVSSTGWQTGVTPIKKESDAALLPKIEPMHEVIVPLFIHHKLIFQMRMCNHPVAIDAWFLVGPFIYFHTSCVEAAKALATLRECAGLSEPSLVAYVISTIISWAGSIV